MSPTRARTPSPSSISPRAASSKPSRSAKKPAGVAVAPGGARIYVSNPGRPQHFGHRTARRRNPSGPSPKSPPARGRSAWRSMLTGKRLFAADWYTDRVSRDRHRQARRDRRDQGRQIALRHGRQPRQSLALCRQSRKRQRFGRRSRQACAAPPKSPWARRPSASPLTPTAPMARACWSPMCNRATFR